MTESSSVRVICRFRPINNREKKEFVDSGKDPNQTICKFIDDQNCEILLEEGLGTKKYSFDRVYPPGVPQRDVYNLSACDTVIQVLNGYNGTILSYGQTGAGKSFSMFGTDINDQEMKGIIPRSGDHIFNHILTCDNQNIEWSIRCSFMEIYNEKVNDLLARGPDHEDLRIRESPERGIYVEDASETQVCSVEDIAAVINVGDSNRTVFATDMNPVSSRSHTVLMIFVRQENKADSSKQEGKMCLVDLAGSEKTSKTNAEGQRLAEAIAINSSLTTLGQCIKMLAESDKGFVPFRNSKLTRLLQESLGGNSKTTLLIACSPHPFNREETISTCEFGRRAKSIKNSVKVNATKSVKELMAIIDKLTVQISGQAKYITLCNEVIQWYQENVRETQCSCYIPTKQDLDILMQGKQLNSTNCNDYNDDQDLSYVDHHEGINDVSVRIADLQSQIEREQQANFLSKLNFEADIQDLQRKLYESQNGNYQKDKTVCNNLDQKQQQLDSDTQLVQLKIENQLLQQKLRIYENNITQQDLEISEERVVNEPTSNYQSVSSQKWLELKVGTTLPVYTVTKQLSQVVSQKALSEQIQLLQDKSDQLQNQQQEKDIVQAQQLLQMAERIKQLETLNLKLQGDNNRVRGLQCTAQQSNEIYDASQIILQMEAELKQNRNVIMVMRRELLKYQFLQQRLDQLQYKLVDITKRLAIKEYNELQRKDNEFNNEETVKHLQTCLEIKQQELISLNQRIIISDQRIDSLTSMLGETANSVYKIQNDNNRVIREKDEETRNTILGFDKQKHKLQDIILSKQSKVYKPVKGLSVAQQLAQSNPDIIQRLNNYKSTWSFTEDGL